MWKCPVCEQSSQGLLCGNCGFDNSRNLEKYPTLGKCTTGTKAISRLRVELHATNTNYLRCSHCGSTQFSFDLEERLMLCAGCSEPLSVTQIKKLLNILPLGAKPKPVAGSLLQLPPEGGTVVASGYNWNGQCEVSSWRNILAIAAGSAHTVGLRNDGTVVAVGSNSNGQCNTQAFSNISAIAAGSFHTVGLRKDGTVVAVGDTTLAVRSWKNITAIAAGGNHTVGLKQDGTVVAVGSDAHGQCQVAHWQDITAIAAGTFHTVGLRRDGTVVAAGNNQYGQCDVQDWIDIVAIAAGSNHTVGLRLDGKLLIACTEQLVCNFPAADWCNLIAIEAGWSSTAAIRADGTVVCPSSHPLAADWTRICALAVGSSHIVGLKCPTPAPPPKKKTDHWTALSPITDRLRKW